MPDVSIVLAYIALCVWIALVGFFNLGSILVVRQLFPKVPCSRSEGTKSILMGHQVSTRDPSPGVSVLRPIRGLDYGLRENLQSMFDQVYSGPIEFLFCLEDPEDQAISIIKSLVREYEKLDARIILTTDGVKSGANPKINTLLPAFHEAQYPILWVLDSNVRVEPGSMENAVRSLCSPGIGLVHHLPFSIEPRGFGARLEQMFLNTTHARMYTGINWTSTASCVNGKSNLYRKEDIKRIGGLEKFAQYLAEDNMIAERILHLGQRAHHLIGMAWQPLGPMSVGAYYGRRSRWSRIRKYNVTAATLFEPFTESLVCGVYGSWALHTLFNLSPLPIFLAHMLTWLVCDILVFRWIYAQRHRLDLIEDQGVSKMKEALLWLSAWAVRESTALPLWIWAMCGTVVNWRGRKYYLRMDGTISRTYA
ncbi:MAG: glycosyl transferase family 21-domain-containing protein [Piptocephalis tieghemiana]|nr:MAG: glycosyl transferase family 21-domain-containing protein [Piptocephalis tieghemiana]